MGKHNMYFKADRYERLLEYTEKKRIKSPSEALGQMIDEKTLKQKGDK